jgi:hypothetical protein
MDFVGVHAHTGQEADIQLRNVSFPVNTPITSAKATEHVVGFATYTATHKHGIRL